MLFPSIWETKIYLQNFSPMYFLYLNTDLLCKSPLKVKEVKTFELDTKK